MSTRKQVAIVGAVGAALAAGLPLSTIMKGLAMGRADREYEAQRARLDPEVQAKAAKNQAKRDRQQATRQAQRDAQQAARAARQS